MQFGVKKGIISGLLYGFIQFCMFFIFGLVLYIGIIFMTDHDLTITDVFTALYSVMFSGMAAGNMFHFMPDT